jgi:hypothetical protein
VRFPTRKYSSHSPKVVELRTATPRDRLQRQHEENSPVMRYRILIYGPVVLGALTFMPRFIHGFGS